MSHRMIRRDDLVLTPLGAHFNGRRLAYTLGRAGILQDKREGDGATPAAGFRITGCLYRPDRVARPAPWARPIGLGELWSDDPQDAAYNQLVRAPYAPSHEALRRPDPLYDLILTTDWNWPDARPGLGSAIFLHQWRRPCYPTAGCIAFARSDLAWLASRAQPGTRIRIRAGA